MTQEVELKTELKEDLTIVLKSMEDIKRKLLHADCKIVREALTNASNAIRPMLWALRTPEENKKQADEDRYN